MVRESTGRDEGKPRSGLDKTKPKVEPVASGEGMRGLPAISEKEKRDVIREEQAADHNERKGGPDWIRLGRPRAW